MRRSPLAAAAAALFCLTGAAAPRPDSAGPSAPTGPAGALHLTIETIAVDRRGTWSVGTDEADLFPGATGVLERTATLIARQPGKAPREMVDLSVQVTPDRAADGRCSLTIKSETKSVVTGARVGEHGPPRGEKDATLVLAAGEQRLIEVYASTVTQGRLALKVSCGPPDLQAAPSELEFIEFSISIDRAEGEAEPKTLKTDQLRAALGREASDLFSFNVPLPDGSGGKRYRREKLEATLAPQIVSGGRLQLGLKVTGEAATVSAGAPAIAHPIDQEETLVLSSGEEHPLVIDLRSSGDEEGWKRVKYTLRVTCRF